MRALKLSLTGTVVLALLGGVGGAAMAQEPEEAPPDAYVTGVLQSQESDPSGAEMSDDGNKVSVRGIKLVETVEWSDSRLPSEVRSVANVDAVDAGLAVSATELYEGPDGSWTSRWTGLCDHQDICHGLALLTGHGAYEGLSAILVTSAGSYEGLIFEGEMPPMPDPVEPSAAAPEAMAEEAAPQAEDEAAAEEAVAETEEEPQVAVEDEEAVDAVEDAAQTPVYVTGTEACTGTQAGTCTVVDGVERCRGFVSDCVNTMSDPRVSGTYTNTYNHDCLAEGGCLFWGTHVLDGPDGGWACSWSGLEEPYADAGNDGLVYVVCPGTGSNEGLTFVSHHAFGGAYDFGDGTSFHGLIYADELPSLSPPSVTES